MFSLLQPNVCAALPKDSSAEASAGASAEASGDNASAAATAAAQVFARKSSNGGVFPHGEMHALEVDEERG